MSRHEADDTIRAWFHEGPERGSVDGLERTLARLAATRQAPRREIRLPLWLPAAAVVAILLALALAFGAGFRITLPAPRTTPGPSATTASAGSCRLEVPVHGRDAILFGTGFAPDTDVTLVFNRANGDVLTLDHSTVGSLHTDRSGGFYMPARPFPEDLGTGHITATAGCATTYEIEVTAADLPAPCPDPATPSQPLVDGPAYRAAVGADRPLAWWRFDDAGTVAVDSAGDHTGTYVGNMEHAVGTPLSDGASMFFHHQFPEPTHVEIQPIVLSGDFTIETWVYFCHWADGDPIVGNADTTANWGFGEGELHLGTGLQDVVWAGEDVISGIWQHEVVTRAGGALAMYRDGELHGSEPESGWTDDFTINLLGGCVDGNYLGYLDELAIYDHALTPERVQAHAHA